MDSVVLDASALLALVQAEPGSDVVENALTGALVSAVNIAETGSRLVDKGMPAEVARATIESLRLRIVPFDVDMAHDVAALRPATRGRGLSLGDRACLALARREGVAALTADRAWDGLDAGVEVRLIR